MVHLLNGGKKRGSFNRKAWFASDEAVLLGVEQMVPSNVRSFNHSRKIRIDAKLSHTDASNDRHVGG
jgi:hypothetical protein